MFYDKLFKGSNFWLELVFNVQEVFRTQRYIKVHKGTFQWKKNTDFIAYLSNMSLNLY